MQAEIISPAIACASVSPKTVRLLPLLPGQYIARSTTIGSLAVTVVRKLAARSPGTALA